MKPLNIVLLILVLVLPGCSAKPSQTARKENPLLIKPGGHTLEERFLVPQGFTRVNCHEGSFGRYLRNLPLKPYGSKVLYYNGEIKQKDVYDGVVDMETGERDLQQCADAVMRLWAEYLYKEQRYSAIHFNFTNGFNAEYEKWRNGYRVAVEGNSTHWVKSRGFSGEYQDFRKYLDMVFTYAGTLSLAKELIPVRPEEMRIGDVFIQGGSPGHCVIVVDMAENTGTGEKIFIIAQSYMPAQDIHILKNQGSKEMSPWYSLNFGDALNTPEWTFQKENLKRFKD